MIAPYVICTCSTRCSACKADSASIPVSVSAPAKRQLSALPISPRDGVLTNTGKIRLSREKDGSEGGTEVWQRSRETKHQCGRRNLIVKVFSDARLGGHELQVSSCGSSE